MISCLLQQGRVVFRNLIKLTEEHLHHVTIKIIGPATVNSISKETGLHRQDIYKILPKLEESGLIIQTLSRPTTLEALPVEAALKNFITIEQKKNKDRINRLKAEIKMLTKVINEEKKQAV